MDLDAGRAGRAGQNVRSQSCVFLLLPCGPEGDVCFLILSDNAPLHICDLDILRCDFAEGAIYPCPIIVRK